MKLCVTLFSIVCFLTIPINLIAAPWRLQDAVGLPHWINVSVEHRSRYESIDNQFRATGRGGDQLISFRTLARVETVFDSWRIGAEVMDSRVELEDSGSPLNTTHLNKIELLQGYIAWDGRDIDDTGLDVSFKAGRITMDIGSRRLVARNRFRNTINGFTGIDMSLSDPNKWLLRGFFTLPVQRLPNNRTDLLNGQAEFDHESTSSFFTGGLFELSALPEDSTLELYTFHLHEEDENQRATRNRRIWTRGFRFYNHPRVGRFDFQLESVYQTGTSRASAQNNDRNDLDHFAHYQHFQIGYTFDYSWQPRFVIEYDYASGDNDPTDDDNNRFDTLFGARRFAYGPTGIWGPFARSNINSPGYRLIANPYKGVNAFISHRAYWLADKDDTWTAARIRDVNGNSGDFLGHHVEARLRWIAVPGTLLLETGWAILLKGEFARNAPNAPMERDNSHYLYTQAVLTF